MKLAFHIVRVRELLDPWSWPTPASTRGRIPFIVVSPLELKKFAMGKTKAEKNVILKSVLKNWGQDLDDDNVADAFVSAAPGRLTGGRSYFTTDISGRSNLWKVRASGGWPIQLTQSDDRQYTAVWSPDAASIT